jgi:hypothetical protein
MSMRRSQLGHSTFQGVCAALFLVPLMLLGSCETKAEVDDGCPEEMPESGPFCGHAKTCFYPQKERPDCLNTYDCSEGLWVGPSPEDGTPCEQPGQICEYPLDDRYPSYYTVWARCTASKRIELEYCEDCCFDCPTAMPEAGTGDCIEQGGVQPHCLYTLETTCGPQEATAVCIGEWRVEPPLCNQ